MPLVDKETERLIGGLKKLPEDDDNNAIELEARRILHSLKAYAEHRGSMELAAAVQDLERDLRSGGIDALVEGLPYVEAMAENLAQSAENPAPVAATEKIPPAATPMVFPKPLVLTLRERSVIQELNRDTLACIRVRISGDEPMPKARALLVLREIEDLATIIRAEVWLGRDGPVNPKSWLDDPSIADDQAEKFGAYIRCLVVPNLDFLQLQNGLNFDLVDVCYCDPAPTHLEAEWQNPQLGASVDLARQRLHLLSRRFMPGPRGLSLRAYADLTHAWKENEKLIFAQESKNLATFLEDFILTEAERHPEAGFAFSCEEIGVHQELIPHVKDMLLQFIRNSLAHGRREDGSKLLIHIDVYESSNRLLFHYHDDGKGIDPVALAWKEGLETGALISDEEILHIISRPGFSSRENPDADAGFGTGLDLVRHLVEERLRGTWELKNKFGRGCGFTVMVPPIMYPMDVLICETGGSYVALPLASVLTEITAGEVGQIAIESGRRELYFGGLRCRLVLTQAAANNASYVILRRLGADPVAVGINEAKASERAFFETNSASVYSRTVGRWVPYFTEDDQV